MKIYFCGNILLWKYTFMEIYFYGNILCIIRALTQTYALIDMKYYIYKKYYIQNYNIFHTITKIYFTQLQKYISHNYKNIFHTITPSLRGSKYISHNCTEPARLKIYFTQLYRACEAQNILLYSIIINNIYKNN